MDALILSILAFLFGLIIGGQRGMQIMYDTHKSTSAQLRAELRVARGEE